MKKVAIVGAGVIGRTHAGAYARMTNAELVAICDKRLDAAEDLAQAYSARAFSRIEDMLSEIELDAVDICSPTSAHLDLIESAAAAGKHISCEKPLARTLAQAQKAVMLCRDAGVTLFVAHVLRWFPEFVKLRELAAKGAVGKPTVVRTTRGVAQPQGSGGWVADKKESGGVVLDMLVHDFDWLRWCFGRVKKVYARGLFDSKIALTDYALVTLRFESGVIAHVEGDWASPGGFRASVDIAGTEGLLSYSSADSVPLVIEQKTEAGLGTVMPGILTATDPYQLELESFINTLESGRAPDVSGEDGLEAVRIAEAALRSISARRPVTLG